MTIRTDRYRVEGNSWRGRGALSLCALLVKSMWIVNLLNVCMIHVGVSIEYRKI